MIKTRIQGLSFLLLMSTLAGCSFTGQHFRASSGFGTGLPDIRRFSEEEFINIRNDTIDMNKKLLAIDSTKAEGLIFDEPLSTDDTETKVIAAKALNAYGDLLVTIVTEDRMKNLQDNFTLLVTKMSVVWKKKFISTKIDAVTRLIAGLAFVHIKNKLTEKKKADAAKKIILIFHEPANELATRLGKDFSLDDDALGFLYAYYMVAKKLRDASMSLVHEMNAGNNHTVIEKGLVFKTFLMADNAIFNATKINKKVNKVIARFQRANVDIVKTINDEKYSISDIKRYAKHVQELAHIYSVIIH